jgi:hypothetical protein
VSHEPFALIIAFDVPLPLADVVTRGDEIILSHKVKAISGEVGVFRKELEYLSEQGYKLASDGLGMVK